MQQQLEDAQIRHVPVEQCTCRMQELGGVKKMPSSTSDKAGYLRLSVKDEELSIDCGKDMFLIKQALLRRSLAYDQTGIISYETMEAWHSYLFEVMQREAPPDSRPISLQQILTADRQMFTRLAEGCRSGLISTAAGVLPADKMMKDLQDDIRITNFLLHHPATTSSGQARPVAKASNQVYNQAPDPSSKRQIKLAKGAAKGGKVRSQPYADHSNAGKGKNKGKGGKKQRPAGLEGTWTHHKGSLMCDGFNLGNCSEAATVSPGSSCSRGLHCCCRPYCGELHPYHQCRKV